MQAERRYSGAFEANELISRISVILVSSRTLITLYPFED